MRTYKEYPTTRTYRHLDVLACDVCDTKVKNPQNENDWGDDYYEFDRTTIKHEHGSSFPEGGTTHSMSVDICPKCFKDIVMNALSAVGVNPKYEETDW